MVLYFFSLPPPDENAFSQTMRNETQKRLHELILEGNACLLSLRNIDKQVGNAFLHLKEVSTEYGYNILKQSNDGDCWLISPG